MAACGVIRQPSMKIEVYKLYIFIYFISCTFNIQKQSKRYTKSSNAVRNAVPVLHCVVLPLIVWPAKDTDRSMDTLYFVERV